MSAPKRTRPVGLKATCPMTGLILDGRRVLLHTIDLRVCSNGTLTAYCALHGARAFVTSVQSVMQIMRNAPSAYLTERHGKEKPNAQGA